MSTPTLTALSQRNEAFWIGLGLMVLGAILSANAPPGEVGVGTVLGGLGTLIIITRVLVALYRIFRTAITAGVVGYWEGTTDE